MSHSFRIYLQETLDGLCSRNPRYSLRSFARRLKVHHSTLSQIMRGRRKLTERMICRFGACLNLSDAEIGSFVQQEHRFPAHHSEREVQLQKAILDLMDLPRFETNVGWISRVLGARPDDVNIALTQLIGMGKLQMMSKGRWVKGRG